MAIVCQAITLTGESRRNNVVYDLNNLLDTPIDALLTSATDMNRGGRILVKSSDGYYVLIPMEERESLAESTAEIR